MLALKLCRSFSTTRLVRSSLYDGTASSIAKKEQNSLLLSRDIPTVELAFDLYNDETSSSKASPSIVILHGLFGSKVNNRSIARTLNKKLQTDVYCLDLRNHGDSPHIKRHDYPSLSADVERFLEDHDLKKPIVIGHSMGAKTAMALVLRRPNLAEMIISVDNSPVSLQPSSLFPRYCSILQEIVADKDINSLKLADQYFAKFEKDVSTRQFLLQNLRTDPETKTLKSRIPLDTLKDILIKGNIAAWDFDSSLNRWTGPALFIRGTKSKYVPDEYIPTIGQYFPNFELRDLDAGHWVLAEKPRESVSLIVDYIEKNHEV